MIDSIQDVEIIITLPDDSEVPFLLQAPMNFKFGFNKIPLLDDFRDADRILRSGHFKYQFIANYEYEWHEMDLRYLLIAEKIMLKFPPEFITSKYQEVEVLLDNDSVVKNYLENFIGKNQDGEIDLGDSMPSGSITLDFVGVQPLSEADIRSIRFYLPPSPPILPPGPAPNPQPSYETEFDLYPDGTPMEPGCVLEGHGYTFRFDTVACDWEIVDYDTYRVIRFAKDNNVPSAPGYGLSVDEFDGCQNCEVTAKVRGVRTSGSTFAFVQPSIFARGTETPDKRFFDVGIKYPNADVSTTLNEVRADIQLTRPSSTFYKSIGRFSPFEAESNQWYYIKFNLVGNIYKFKYWVDGNAEPDEWNQVGLLAEISDGGWVGMLASYQRPFEIGYFKIQKIADSVGKDYYETDFSEYHTSAAGYWESIGVASPSTRNSDLPIGHVVRTTSSGGGGRDGGSYWLKPGILGNSEILTLGWFPTGTTLTYHGAGLRFDPFSTDIRGYNFTIIKGNGEGIPFSYSAILEYYSTNSSDNLSGNNGSTPIRGNWFWSRVRAIGDVIMAKFWELDEAEPDEWLLEVSDSTYPTGYAWLYARLGVSSGSRYNYVAVSGGETIPLPYEILPGYIPPDPGSSFRVVVLVTDRDAALRWNDIGSGGYNIFLDSGSGFEQINDSPVFGDSYFIYNLDSGVYNVYVTSINPSLTTDTVEFSINLPKAQSSVLSVEVLGDKAAFSWTKVNFAYVVGYELYLDSGSGFIKVGDFGKNTLSTDIIDLASGNYDAYVIVKASSGIDNSDPSNTVNFDIIGPYADSPINFDVFVDGTTAQCSWDAVADADGYNVYLDSGSGYVKVNVSLIETTTFDIEDLTEGTYKAYVTTERSGYAESLPSNIENFAIGDGPDNFVVVVVGTTAQCSWDSVVGADGYNVYLSRNDGAFERKNPSLILTEAYNVNGLLAGNYRGFVKSVESSVESGPSNIEVFDINVSGYVQINSPAGILGTKAEGKLKITGSIPANITYRARLQRLGKGSPIITNNIFNEIDTIPINVARDIEDALKLTDANLIFDISRVSASPDPYVLMRYKTVGALGNNWFLDLIQSTSTLPITTEVPHNAEFPTEGGNNGTYSPGSIDLIINNSVFATTPTIDEGESVASVLTKLLNAANDVGSSVFSFSIVSNRLVINSTLSGPIPIALNVRNTGISYQTVNII